MAKKTPINWSEFSGILKTYIDTSEGKRNHHLFGRVDELKEFLHSANPDFIYNPALLSIYKWREIYLMRKDFKTHHNEDFTRLLKFTHRLSHVADAINTTRKTKTIPDDEFCVECMVYWLGEYLQKKNWKNIQRIYANPHGNDLYAEKENIKLVTIVKNPPQNSSGITSTVGGRIITLLNQRLDNPDIQIAVAIPDNKIIKKYLRGILPTLSDLKVKIFWIASNTKIKES